MKKFQGQTVCVRTEHKLAYYGVVAESICPTLLSLIGPVVIIGYRIEKDGTIRVGTDVRSGVLHIRKKHIASIQTGEDMEGIREAALADVMDRENHPTADKALIASFYRFLENRDRWLEASLSEELERIRNGNHVEDSDPGNLQEDDPSDDESVDVPRDDQGESRQDS